MTMKLYHWNTTSYARHKASDEFGGNLAELMDKFVEVFMGKYGYKPLINGVKIDTSFITEDGNVALLQKTRETLQTLDRLVKDTDLLNIRDELLAEVNKTLYLYQLK